jgi:FtsH-binding integral membrane protein
MSSFQQSPFGAFAPGQSIEYRSREQEVTVRQFFNAVYAWMCAGLALTAVVSYLVAESGRALLSPGLLIVAFIVQIALVMVISRAINRISTPVATALFLVYAALMGVTLSVLFLMYTKTALASTFIVTAGAFGAMSLYGYTTGRDLTRLGSLLFMALIGLILASVVNIFMASSGLQWIISWAGVLIFVGLTAYDTQKLKMIAMKTGDNPALANRLAIVGSLTLYLDFINLFIFLLQVMNRRR